jgi:solute carrier family 50 protein (sugar transporter)
MYRPTFVQIWKKGSVEHYSPAPYLVTLVNCMVWTLYGLPMVHPHSTLVLTIDGPGIAIELTYIIIFFIFSDRKKRLIILLELLIELIFICVVTPLVLTLAHSNKERSLIVGIIGILFNVMMYASPLVVMVSRSTLYYHANMVLNLVQLLLFILFVFPLFLTD